MKEHPLCNKMFFMHCIKGDPLLFLPTDGHMIALCTIKDRTRTIRNASWQNELLISQMGINTLIQFYYSEVSVKCWGKGFRYSAQKKIMIHLWRAADGIT